MLIVCLTFIVTSALFLAVGCLALARISRHLKGNAQAMAAVVEHVLVPLFGRQEVAQDETECDELTSGDQAKDGPNGKGA